MATGSIKNTLLQKTTHSARSANNVAAVDVVQQVPAFNRRADRIKRSVGPLCLAFRFPLLSRVLVSWCSSRLSVPRAQTSGRGFLRRYNSQLPKFDQSCGIS
jgi:hypothetical protein